MSAEMSAETARHPLVAVVRDRFGGRLAEGRHGAGDVACALEAAHVAAGDEWSDTPDRWPDVRLLNDAPWPSAEARAAGLVPVLVAYWDWADWSHARRQTVTTRVVLDTIRELVAELPRLPDALRETCRGVETVEHAARAAADAVEALQVEAGAAKAASAEIAFGSFTAAAAAFAASGSVPSAAAWSTWAEDILASKAAKASGWAARAAAMVAKATEAGTLPLAAKAAAAAVKAAAWAAGAGAEAGAEDVETVLARACALWIRAALADGSRLTGRLTDDAV